MPRHLSIAVVMMLMAHQAQAFIKDSPDPSSAPNVANNLLLEMMTKISLRLDTIDLHYHAKLEDKLLTMTQLLASVDSNVKQLQEKAQVWDIFRHHIASWSDNIKSSDQKIELLRRAMESLPVIENQLQNTDFKVQHIFDKVDGLVERQHEVARSLNEIQRTKLHQQHESASTKAPKKRDNNWSQEDFEQTEILMRLSKLQRTLQSTCSSMRMGREIDGELRATGTSSESQSQSESLRALVTKVNSNLEKLPTVRELKQHCKKHEKSLESLANLVGQIDERTIRIFDANSYHFKRTLSSCKSAEHEMLTFTTNADMLLKRAEASLKSFDVFNEKCSADRKTAIGGGEGESGGDGGSAEMDDEDETEYVQPRKTNCFQLTTGRSGVYTFGTERRTNAMGRDFHRQFCEYSTEGTAWTIIQKRDNFVPAESFNRTWADYRHGFGDLARDFWFGNDFVHELTRDRDMVLRIVLEDFRDNHVWVEYGIFRIDSESQSYRLHVDEYRGSIADSFLHHSNAPFSTFDRRSASDAPNATLSCAERLGAGWWFTDCAESNLNGAYHDEPLGEHSREYKGIFWEHWLGDYSLKASKMMIRPKDVWYSTAQQQQQPDEDDLIEIQNEDLMLVE